MPHVIVKLWPGKSEAQKKRLAQLITEDVMSVLEYGGESVSVAFQEVSASDWREQVCVPDILDRPKQVYEKPGYTM
jgi:4-oxalocrotonate tautomerase